MIPNNSSGAATKDLSEMSRAVTTDFKVPVPKGLALMDFQRAGVEFMCNTRNVLLGDEPGLGKTVQSIGFMNVRNIDSVLVLCPASVCNNWVRELRKWRKTDLLEIKIFGSKEYKKDPRCDVLVMSYAFASYSNSVKKVLTTHKYEYLVLDECHYLKEKKSKRTKYVLAKNGLRSKAKFVHALSGTPITNRPIELYPIIKSLSPETIGGLGYFGYAIEYCGAFKTEYGWDFRGSKNMKELGQRLRKKFLVRRRKTDVLTQLPDKFPPNIVYLEQDATVKKLIQRMAVFSKKALSGSGPDIPFEELSLVRRELGEAKAQDAATYIKTQLTSGHEKIIVFAHHKKVVEILWRELKEFGVCLLVGGQTAAQKQLSIDEFQTKKEKRIFLGSITAAGVGITLTAASYVVFVEFSWVPGENEQAIDRAHRIGQTEGVMIDYLVHENSLDERMLETLIDKQKVLNELLT